MAGYDKDGGGRLIAARRQISGGTNERTRPLATSLVLGEHFVHQRRTPFHHVAMMAAWIKGSHRMRWSSDVKLSRGIRVNPTVTLVNLSACLTEGLKSSFSFFSSVCSFSCRLLHLSMGFICICNLLWWCSTSVYYEHFYALWLDLCSFLLQLSKNHNPCSKMQILLFCRRFMTVNFRCKTSPKLLRFTLLSLLQLGLW